MNTTSHVLLVGTNDPVVFATTPTPLRLGTAYYTRLDVTVNLTGGSSPSASFITPAIRMT